MAKKSWIALNTYTCTCVCDMTENSVCYIVTGSGKTYTIEGGSEELQGIIPRATQLIFSRIQNIYLPFTYISFFPLSSSLARSRN